LAWCFVVVVVVEVEVVVVEEVEVLLLSLETFSSDTHRQTHTIYEHTLATFWTSQPFDMHPSSPSSSSSSRNLVLPTSYIQYRLYRTDGEKRLLVAGGTTVSTSTYVLPYLLCSTGSMYCTFGGRGPRIVYRWIAAVFLLDGWI